MPKINAFTISKERKLFANINQFPQPSRFSRRLIIGEGHVYTEEKIVVEFVKNESADILGMSALLTTTMIYMKETIETLKNAGLRQDVKVIIGGAPVTESYAAQIDADGYASDAASAVDLSKKLLDE